MPLVTAFEPDRAVDAAISAGRWIVATQLRANPGLRPRAGDEGANLDLYSGTAGVLVFLSWLSGLTGEEWSAGAAKAATEVLFEVAEQPSIVRSSGLYSGLGGMAFALGEQASSRQAAHRLVDELIARPAAPEDCTDVISGTAGYGLSLLWAAKSLDREDALAAALAAGDHLLSAAESADTDGRAAWWKMRATDDYVMPNFSHGTAGVAFFLARLAHITGEERYVAAAEAGGRHLLAISDRTGSGRLVHHHAPGGESLHYLGWCHGPPGTTRLFQQLHSTTGDPSWSEARDSLVEGLLATGIPQARPDGFWKNVGRCCGDVGVAEFAQDLIDLDRDADGRLRRLRDACTDHILDWAVETDTDLGKALSWPHAEHRARPDEIRASPGLMQGAAGIGLWLLRAGTSTSADSAPPRLPDDVRPPPAQVPAS